MYDSLYGQVTRSTPTRLTQCTVKTETSIYQPRPTSASHNDPPAAFNDLTDLSCPQRSSSCILRHDQPQLPATIVQLHSTTRPTAAVRNAHPAASYDSADLSFPQRSSSCIQRLDRPQLPATLIQLHSTTRPTSAVRNDHPAASYDLTDLSFPQRSSSCIQRLDRPQLFATIIQLHPTTRPTSASRYVRPAAFYDSIDSYLHQTSSCISTTRHTPATLIGHPAAHIYDSTIPAIDITHQIQLPRILHTRLWIWQWIVTFTSPLFPSLSLAVITRTH